MSMTGTSIWDTPDDPMAPQFTKVLKGYDPMEVDAYVFEAKARIDELEREVRTARDERDNARRQFADVADDVYRDIADRMAEVIEAADKQAQKMLAEAERDAGVTVATAEREAAEGIRRAELELERLRRQGEERTRLANAEVDRILGGLMLRRDDIIAELRLVRQRTLGVVEKIDSAVAVSSVSPHVPEASNGEGPGAQQAVPGPMARPQIVKIPSEDDDFPSMDDGALPFEGGLEPVLGLDAIRAVNNAGPKPDHEEKEDWPNRWPGFRRPGTRRRGRQADTPPAADRPSGAGPSPSASPPSTAPTSPRSAGRDEVLPSVGT